MTSVPTSAPRRTRTCERNEYDVRQPFGWRTTTCSEPATAPAKTTVPGPTACTGVPGAARKSTSRWPGPKRDLGRSNGRTTGPRTGLVHTDAPADAPVYRPTNETRNTTTRRRTDDLPRSERLNRGKVR